MPISNYDNHDSLRVSQSDIDRAIGALNSGQVIAIPTDTVYGLAASLRHPEAMAQLYTIKERAPAKPIPVLIDTLEYLDHLEGNQRILALALAEAFWPGALTLIVVAPESIPEAVHRGAGTVGLRIPDHRAARAIISGAGGGLAVTSANHSGEPEARSAAEVSTTLGDVVPVIIDGGPIRGTRSSTVVDLTAGSARILRHGEISPADIQRAVSRSSSG